MGCRHVRQSDDHFWLEASDFRGAVNWSGIEWSTGERQTDRKDRMLLNSQAALWPHQHSVWPSDVVSTLARPYGTMPSKSGRMTRLS
jgi:hypothetical protein